ncbi:MAG: hypothetical protein Q4C72_04805 [Eubacteriales bacterium]|nr:hypothetical protein [Eubacteriales bacterium]
MEKFHIPKRSSWSYKTVRLPDEMIEKIQKRLMGTQTSFNAFIVGAVWFALDHLQEEND